MVEDTKLKIYFSMNMPEEQHPLPGQIIITPTSDKWNDFGYHIRCTYKACFLDRITRFEGDIFIGFLEPKSVLSRKIFDEVNESLYKYLNGFNDSVFVSESDLPSFFTMQPSIQHYRTLISDLGTKSTNHLLTSLNDLIVFKKQEPEWFLEAVKTKVFVLGFLRNSQPFYAFHNADALLDGLKNEVVKNVSENLKLKFKLEGYENHHELDLKFKSESIVPRRIAILIGKNGLGKSEALKAFCRGALQYSDKGLELTSAEHSRPMINRVIAIATPGETVNTFPREQQKNQKIYYRRLSLTRKGTRSIASALVQLVRSDDSIGNRSRWTIFKDALSKALPVENLFIRKNNDSLFPLEFLDMAGGEEDTLTLYADLKEGFDPVYKKNENKYPLSSGQLTFFKFALMCCLHIENGSFVLMDEPETHLHPNLISDFVSLLDELLEISGSFAILSTHSAYFVREVSKEQVHVFKESENKITITQPRLRTFGSDVDSISQFVFEEDIESALTDKVFQKVKNMKSKEIDKALGQELSLAALIDLKGRLEGVI